MAEKYPPGDPTVIQQGEQLWINLRHAGIVSGEFPSPEKPDSPWYIKVLLILSGWLAALFILGFIGTGFYFVFKTSIVAFIIGLIMIGGAYILLNKAGNEFTEHLALAVSLAGQSLVVFALFDFFNHRESVAWFLTMLLEIPLAIIMPSFVHRVFSSFAATFASSMILRFAGWPQIISSAVMLGTAWCWLNEFRYPQQLKTLRAIGYGLVIALILLKGTTLFGHRLLGIYLYKGQPGFWGGPWIGGILSSFVMLFVVYRFLLMYHLPFKNRLSILALLGTLLVCAVSLKVQGLTAGLLILLLGFSGSNRVLIGLGITSLLFFISSYYYLLDETLLTKSQHLSVVGLVLLCLRWFVHRFLIGEKEADHV